MGLRSDRTDGEAESDERDNRSQRVSTATKHDRSVSTAAVVERETRSSSSRSRNRSPSGSTADRIPDEQFMANKRSVHRSRYNAKRDGLDEADANVPESVRKVVSSSGHSLDASVQRTMESRMGEDFSDVQVHTGPRAAKAAEDIDAKAFTVGNHVAFNRGEYDPASAEGQHVIAHELAHVRQQTGGAVSMLPKDDVELEIDPDPELEREAEETAQRVMQGGELGIQRLEDTDVHVQRVRSHSASAAAGSSGAGSLSRPTWPPRGRPDHAAFDMPQIEAQIGRSSNSFPQMGSPRPDHVALEIDSVQTEAGSQRTPGEAVQAAQQFWNWASSVEWLRHGADLASGFNVVMSGTTLHNAQRDQGPGPFMSDSGQAGGVGAGAAAGGALTTAAFQMAACPYCEHRNASIINGGGVGTVGGGLLGAAAGNASGMSGPGSYLGGELGGYAGAYTANAAASWDENLPGIQQAKNLYHTDCENCNRRYNMFKALHHDYRRQCRETHQREGKAPPENIPESRRNRKQEMNAVLGPLANIGAGYGVAQGVGEMAAISGDQPAGPMTPIGAGLTPLGLAGEPMIQSITCPNAQCRHVNRYFIHAGLIGSATGNGVGSIHAFKKFFGDIPVRTAATTGAVSFPIAVHAAKQATVPGHRAPWECTCEACNTSWNLFERGLNWAQYGRERRQEYQAIDARQRSAGAVPPGAEPSGGDPSSLLPPRRALSGSNPRGGGPSHRRHSL